MELTRKKASFLKQAVQDWKNSGLLNEAQAEALSADIRVIPFEWRKLAKYSLWISLACVVIALSSIFADQELLGFLERVFHAPDLAKCIALALVSAAVYAFGVRRRLRFPEKVYTNEAILFFGILATAGSIGELGRAFDNGSGHFSILLLISFLIYGALGVLFRSNLIWVFSLASLGSWFGTETGYVSGWGAYYLGMNYPLRFVFFGGVLLAACFALQKQERFKLFFKSTLVMGLLYFFIAFWILSIFGNYGDLDSWHTAKQIELFHWSLLFGLAAGGAIYHGLRFDNGITKGFGITFLFINLYTRFFEYFWDTLHKAIFFSFLAVTFWLIGSKAERIWKLGRTGL